MNLFLVQEVLIEVSWRHLSTLIFESVSSPLNLCLTMDQIKQITEKLNPNPKSIITGGQPLYALVKKINGCSLIVLTCESQDRYIFKKFYTLVEYNFSKNLNPVEWLEGSLWRKIYHYYKISKSEEKDGKINTFIPIIINCVESLGSSSKRIDIL